MNVPEEIWLNMNPNGAPSNGLDKVIHLFESTVVLIRFLSGRRVFAHFGVHENGPLTGCSRVVNLLRIPKGASTRLVLSLFFKTLNKGRLDLVLSGLPESIELAVVVIFVC